jgi:hypothetical protein
MRRPDDPAIGVEYHVTGHEISAESLIPVEHGDTGNLIVEHFGDIAREDGTRVPWNEDAFVDYVDRGVLERADTGGYE